MESEKQADVLSYKSPPHGLFTQGQHLSYGGCNFMHMPSISHRDYFSTFLLVFFSNIRVLLNCLWPCLFHIYFSEHSGNLAGRQGLNQSTYGNKLSHLIELLVDKTSIRNILNDNMHCLFMLSEASFDPVPRPAGQHVCSFWQNSLQ